MAAAAILDFNFQWFQGHWWFYFVRDILTLTFLLQININEMNKLKNEMVRDEVIMNNRMEWSWFRVLIKVEQINDNLFLNTCKGKNKQKIAWMNEVKVSWYEMKMRWKGQAGSIPEISVREKPRWVQIMVERKCERDEILILWEREKWRDQRYRSQQ